ncbi:S8 family serine peptidase [Pseudobacillus sp. FSL P4-0506]|uniref:S8 family serine peptidase n=1 Tax=unclassified Pseudobacillus TaxID=2619284 RepID=UPI0030F4DC6C
MGIRSRLRQAAVVSTAALVTACTIFTTGTDQVKAAEPSQPVEEKFQGDYAKGELIIQFNRALEKAERQAIYTRYGLSEEDSLQHGLFVHASIKKKQELSTVAAELMKEEAVKQVEPNYQLTNTFKPSDSYYNRQWFHSKINAPKAWDRTRGSSQVTVAVIDGGMDTRHVEFKSRLVNPYNAVTGRTALPFDNHGTHVAGIIGAAMNGSGVTGVAPGVKIMPINVFQGEYADSYTIAEAMIYAVDKGADILNLSLGSYSYSNVIEYAANYAINKGAMVVAAAGNEDTSLPFYPAALSNVISVSATSSLDKIADFSNFGRYINLSAPGEDILSTTVNNSYSYMDGTSMAAPVVSGTSALVLSKNPFLSPQQVTRILYKSSVDLGTKSWDSFYGNGRVDAYKALAATPEPMGSISLNTTEFKVTGSNNLRAGLSVSGSMRGTVYVEGANGKNVRTLISGAAPQKGGFVAYWNGKLADGTIAPAGKYSIVFRTFDNHQSLTKKAAVKLIHNLPPSIKAEVVNEASSASQTNVNIKFTINKSLFVTAAVYNNKGQLVKTLLNKKALPARSHRLSWNGTNENVKRMPEGTYKLVITGRDLQNNQVTEETPINL